MVAKLLYICRQTQKYIQTVFAFLCSRVKTPDKDDHKKHTKVMYTYVELENWWQLQCQVYTQAGG